MGKFTDALQTQAAGAVGSVVNTGLGLLLEGHNDRRQLNQQGKLNEQQFQIDKRAMDYNYQKQLDMWKATSYQGQMEQLSGAGLNPGLIYGMGGAGGATTGSGGGSVKAANAPSGGGEIMGLMNMRLMDAQRKVLESQAHKNEVEADKTAGADTDNVKADTANKVLQKVILDYTGKELKDTYDLVKAPNRGVEADTYQTELEARKGTAYTIYELWAEGKLKDKSVAEIEGILLQNAKTREETRKIYKDMELIEQNIKGAKLDNIITELEAKLQTETGIDRNSPYWMKILGRLFVGLTGK